MQIKKITIKVCIGVGFLFVFLMLSILYMTPIPYYAHSFSICWHLIYSFLNGASMMNILSFEIIATGSTRSSSNKASVKLPNSTNSGGASTSAHVESSNTSAS